MSFCSGNFPLPDERESWESAGVKTARIYANEADDGLWHDYNVRPEKLAPRAPTSQYPHNPAGADNMDAHLKRPILGREVAGIIAKSKLGFGW